MISAKPTSGQRRRNPPEENVNFRSARKGVPRSINGNEAVDAFRLGVRTDFG